jgi:hypothetical protein
MGAGGAKDPAAGTLFTGGAHAMKANPNTTRLVADMIRSHDKIKTLNRALDETGGEILLAMSHTTAVHLIGQLSFALAHPTNRGASAHVAAGLIRTTMAGLPEAVARAMAGLLPPDIDAIVTAAHAPPLRTAAELEQLRGWLIQARADGLTLTTTANAEGPTLALLSWILGSDPPELPGIADRLTNLAQQLQRHYGKT